MEAIKSGRRGRGGMKRRRRRKKGRSAEGQTQELRGEQRMKCTAERRSACPRASAARHSRTQRSGPGALVVTYSGSESFHRDSVGARAGRLGSSTLGFAAGSASVANTGVVQRRQTRHLPSIAPTALFSLFPFIKEKCHRFSSAEFHGNDFLFFSLRLAPGGGLLKSI